MAVLSVDDKELLLSVQSSPTPFEESITQPSVQPSVSFSPRSSQHSSSKNPDEESVELVQEADLLSQMDEFSTDLTLAQAHREVLRISMRLVNITINWSEISFRRKLRLRNSVIK